ncbi:MAG TPA: ParB/RepB/Spo0J family partition protein [Candidatus Sulfotelmatobacter sp.]|nr:ParB/RepB/Spo0J family partition protein [Candidatus Sulfotelmatobacter sp.]
MTTSTAGNLAEHAEKEKVEKRRALGRGLESLLPRPRVVAGTAVAPGQGAGAVGGQQIPPLRQAQGRNDNVPLAIRVTTGAEAPLQKEPPDAALKGRASTVLESSVRAEMPQTTTHAATQPSVSAGSEVETGAGTPAAHIGAGQAMAAVATLPEGSPYELAYADPLGDLAGRPATDPRGGQPAYDSSAGGGPIEINAAAETRVPANLVINLPIHDVDKNPFQTRYVDDDEALEELAESIKANGVVQPIVVRPSEESGRYTLILGERRLHASRKAGKTHIPALVRRVSEQQAAEMTIVENLQREDLSPLEQAEAFRVLSNQFSMTQQQIAERVGLSRVSVANYMRLLKLPREVMQMLAEKRLNFAQARELLKLGDDDRIAEAALYAVKKGMNIEQIEMLVLRMDGLLDPLPDMPGVKKREKTGGARWVDPNVRAAQLDLERLLGMRVRIRDRKGKGKIVIEYSTVDDYERVVEMLRAKR